MTTTPLKRGDYSDKGYLARTYIDVKVFMPKPRPQNIRYQEKPIKQLIWVLKLCNLKGVDYGDYGVQGPT